MEHRLDCEHHPSPTTFGFSKWERLERAWDLTATAAEQGCCWPLLACCFGKRSQGLRNYFPSLKHAESENNLGWMEPLQVTPESRGVPPDSVDTVWIKHCMRWAEDAATYKQLSNVSCSGEHLVHHCLSRLFVQDLPIWPVPQKVQPCSEWEQGLALPSDLFFKPFFHQQKGKVPDARHRGLGKVRPSCKLNTKGRCVCLHNTNPNCWKNWDSAHPQHPRPKQRGDPSALCWAAVYPPHCVTAWLVQTAPEDAGKQLLRRITEGCNAYVPGWMRSHISRLQTP